MFPFIQQPHPIQQHVINFAHDLVPPTLLILEAPTGSGKTEIALWLADTWLQRYRGRGFYVAMPTQATSNQMFDRVAEFLGERYPSDLINVNLAHGQAGYDERMDQIRLHRVGEDESGRVAALSWFTQQSKRTLLAPFGVGTVDQTLLSVLQTNHFFVRLFGLSDKVVIFDEIHAYDIYMTTLFERLLTWLRAMGTSVILLSATLPQEARRQLVRAYTAQDLVESDRENAYPALIVGSGEQPPLLRSLPSPPNYLLEVEWLPSRESAAVVEHLHSVLAEGGCAAVLCNTVGRAQAVFRALEKANLVPQEELILFHARFPPIWRRKIEETVLEKFGKPHPRRKRPERAIVVATQVIEQSLDLDFDVMISDLAPIDLLLQRAGRLHRHDRGDRSHPRRLVIARPDLRENDVPLWGSDGYVYEPYVLLRSYLTLAYRAESTLCLPEETVTLIEAVYGKGELKLPSEAWVAALQEARQKMEKDNHAARFKAKQQLVELVTSIDLLRQTNQGLEEDNPAVHRTFRARTRDIAPGVRLVCLHRREGGVSLAPDGETFSLEIPPDRDQVREMLQHTLTLHQWSVLEHFLDAKMLPISWQRSSVLRYCRPLILENGVYTFSTGGKTFTLRLNRRYGLEILTDDDSFTD